jgi:electron transport complex protein RnfD
VGTRAGCIGETSGLLILVAFVFLLIMKIIDWRAPVAMVAVVAVLSAMTGANALMSILSGGLLFGAVFMTTDYTTTPVTGAGRLVFGAGCGLITFLIRKYGGYPEGVMFSILIMNIVVPFLNYLIPKKYGYVKPVKAPKEGQK